MYNNVSASLVFMIMLVGNTYRFYDSRKDAKTQLFKKALQRCIYAFSIVLFRGCLLFQLLFIASSFLTAQSTYLSFLASPPDQEVLKQLAIPNVVSRKDSIQSTLENIIYQLREKGYYAASINRTVLQDSTLIATISLGSLYNKFQIQNGNILSSIWEQANLNIYANREVDFYQLEELKETLLRYGENHGYPFATVWLEDIQIDNSKIIASLFWNPGPLITIGEVKIEGEEVVSTNYLQNYLGIQNGHLYHKERLEEATTSVQELPFLKSTRNPTVLFEEDKANLYFFLESQPANRFNFLIGVLPNNQQTEKTLITADIDAAFYNQFGRGEQLKFQFQQLQPETQQLALGLAYPYLLNTPLGIDLDFKLYKRDTTYRDLHWRIGVQYQFSSTHYLSAFSQLLSTTLLSIDPKQIIEQQKLPANLDTRYSSFGVTYHQEQLDFRLNPRKGWSIDFLGSAGFKTVQQNDNILTIATPNLPATTFGDLYEAIEAKSFQYQLEGQVATFLPIWKRSTLQFLLQAATIISPQPIFNNEQYRIGGAQLLRGFDEQSIFAASYALGTVEYRYLIGRRSYFHVFNDIAWVKNSPITSEVTQNWLLGVGAGMAFETKAGIFGISYALGKTRNTPFDFKKAKLHFGFVNAF